MDQHPSVNNLYLSERLQKTLAGVGSHTVTTVIAPMGYGKSTALKCWQQQLAARIPHAQVFRQLVAADSRQDFWDGFCRALRSRPVLAGQLQALGFPADPHTMRLLHELLQDALAGHPDPVFSFSTTCICCRASICPASSRSLPSGCRRRSTSSCSRATRSSPPPRSCGWAAAF